MQLTNIGYRSGAETWLQGIDLSLAPGAVNVLLGPTRAGKTTLLRIMAGLDPPSSGRISAAGRDVTGVSVRQRDVAMVYQQFINYPSFTVYENIASPLRIQGRSRADIAARVSEIAGKLQLTPLLHRYPAELSGGQQQRTALARALAKDAALLLLDEPLVNLDYKLREELRDELLQLFRERQTTVVYATTDPREALQLGGCTTLVSEGRVLQSGETLEVFRRPATLAAAQAFSDPPINVLPARVDATGTAVLADTTRVCLGTRATAARDKNVLLGIRAHELHITRPGPPHATISARVDLAEISGSETFVHLSHGEQQLVALLPGVHQLPPGSSCDLFVDPAHCYGFTPLGDVLFVPER